jgi:hypothetical protein
MAASAPTPNGGLFADDALRHRELSAEENAEWVRRAKATEADLRARLAAELEASKTAELRVSETWRKVLRLSKVRGRFGLRGARRGRLPRPRRGHTPPRRTARAPRHPRPPRTPPPPHTHSQTAALREDISSAAEAFDREIERRNAAVAAAQAALADLDAQQAQVFSNHLLGMERLAALNDGRLADLHAEFVRETRAMEEEFMVDRGNMVSRHAAFRAELLHELQAVREEAEARVASETSDFVSARDALRRQALEHLHTLQGSMDSRVEGSERAFEEAHAAYVAATAQRATDFKVLTERAAAGAAVAERQATAAARLQRLIVVWRSRTLNAGSENRARNEDLAREAESMAAQVDKMKAEIMRKRRAHAARLKLLSAAAATVKTRLAEAATTAERLLVAADAVRTHEPPLEKVDPFRTGGGGGIGGGAREAAEEAEAAAEALRRGGDGAAAGAAAALGLPPSQLAPGAAEALAEASALAPFYARFNRVLLESLALARRRDRLRAEHADLRDALTQARDGLRVTPAAVDGANGLVVVNGRVAADAGAGTAGAPSRAALVASFAATGAPQQRGLPVRLGGPTVVPVRPGAPGVATVVVEANTVVNNYAKLGVLTKR